MLLTFLADARFEGTVVFFVGTAFLPARTFLGALEAAALVALAFVVLAASDFFSTTFLGGVVLTAVFAFAMTLLAEVDLTAVAFVGAALAGRAFAKDFKAIALAGLF